jgi:hypothetical protein
MRILSQLGFIAIFCTAFVALADEAVCPARPGACEQCPVHHCAAVACPGRQVAKQPCPGQECTAGQCTRKQCPLAECPGEAVAGGQCSGKQCSAKQHLAKQRIGKQCSTEACPCDANLTAAATKPLGLDIRVLEINASKVHAIGFDFEPFAGFSKTRQDPETVPGVIVSEQPDGLVELLSALQREGVVQQDVTFSHKIADGQTLDTVVRWHQHEAEGKKDVWRKIHLRVRPTSPAAGAVALEGACSATFSLDESCKSCSSERPSVELIDFGGELAEGALCLVPTFVGADPEQFPKDETYVIVLITRQTKSACPSKCDEKSRPDLLAPRNVLTRQAAVDKPTRSSDLAEPTGDAVSMEAPLVRAEDLDFFNDESLFESHERLGSEDVFVTPDEELLAFNLPPEIQAEVRRLFVAKLPKQPRSPRVRRNQLQIGGIWLAY